MFEGTLVGSGWMLNKLGEFIDGITDVSTGEGKVLKGANNHAEVDGI